MSALRQVDKFLGFLTSSPLPVTDSPNLPSLGQNLAEPLSISAEVICYGPYCTYCYPPLRSVNMISSLSINLLCSSIIFNVAFCTERAVLSALDLTFSFLSAFSSSDFRRFCQFFMISHHMVNKELTANGCPCRPSPMWARC